MKDFPLIRELGLRILSWGVDFRLHQGQTPADFGVDAEALEVLLEKGVRVKGDRFAPAGELQWKFSEREPGEFTALAIAIRPMVKDTAESLLEEILFKRYQDTLIGTNEWREFQDRARKVLASRQEPNEP